MGNTNNNEPPRPLTTRATREQQRLATPTSTRQRPTSSSTTSNPIGSALGSLVVGTWGFIFIGWFHLAGIAFWIVACFGFLWVALGLFLAAISLNELIAGRRHPHG